jgi:serine/threonine protein kinase
LADVPYVRRGGHPEVRGVATETAGLRERLQAALGAAYTLERELGGGGMSRVFVAEDTRLGRRVVVKVLAPDLAAGLSPERFEREIRLAARLQHPNVVPVLAARERDGLAYYTMPYVEGESLRARLARDGRLSVEAAVAILRDVVRALEYAHAHGVVHRDVKPDNILLAGSAAAVADFGIAKALHAARTAGAADPAPETLTRVGTSLGTPAYMAPEQAAGDPDVDARADVYAWGVVAYELLAGAPPFAGRAAHRLVAAHIGEVRGDWGTPDLYHLMKARHFATSGTTVRTRAHADSVIALLEPVVRRGPGIGVLVDLFTPRATLAEAYAYAGRATDGARVIDQYVDAKRRRRNQSALDLPYALVTAAYVDVLIGRRDLAVAQLEEALRLPAGQWISRALLQADPSWAPLRGHPAFERLIAGT